jgi:hypothetical protein
MPASHLGKPRLTGFHDFVQVLEGAVLDLDRLIFVPMNNPLNAKHSFLSPPHLPGQALAGRLFFPIRAHVDLISPATALCADNAALEVWDLRFSRIAPNFY